MMSNNSSADVTNQEPEITPIPEPAPQIPEPYDPPVPAPGPTPTDPLPDSPAPQPSDPSEPTHPSAHAMQIEGRV